MKICGQQNNFYKELRLVFKTSQSQFEKNSFGTFERNVFLIVQALVRSNPSFPITFSFELLPFEKLWTPLFLQLLLVKEYLYGTSSRMASD